MQVKVEKLFAVVVALALVIVCGLSIHLFGQGSEIVQSDVVLQLHQRPLHLARALADSQISRTNRTTAGAHNKVNDSVSVQLNSGINKLKESEVAGSLISLFNTSSVWTQTLNDTIGASPSLSSRFSSSTHHPTPSPISNSYTITDVKSSSPGVESSSLPWATRTNITTTTLTKQTTSVPNTKATLSSSEPPAPQRQTTTLQTLVSTSAPVTPETSSQRESRGYVLAENYYEQQTMGLRNMMQLQCWAQTLGMSVVKPVMHDSFLRTPLDSTQQSNFIKFEDSFDQVEWASQTDKLGYAPLVAWSEFLTRAPRNVVAVQFLHPSVSTVKSRQRGGQGILISPDSKRYSTGCSGKWPTSRDMYFLNSNGFRIIRKVCFNFYYGDQLTLREFNGHVLGDLSPSSVTIILETWRGISTAQRVLLKDVCQNTALAQEHISLSPRLLQQTQQYRHKYLGDGSGKYLAVMGRLEISQLTVHKKVPVVPFCLQETLTQWRQFRASSTLKKTFLSIDIGRFGTKKYRSGLQPEIEMAFRKFFQSLFGMTASVKEWENSFELVAGTRDAGYIGLLQKALVSRAECVLFVGGGAFQRHALYLYKQLHPDPRDQCYHIVKQCTRSNKLS